VLTPPFRPRNRGASYSGDVTPEPIDTHEGINGHHMLLRERLWPSAGTWAFTTLMTVSIGVAFASAVAPWVGAIAFTGIHLLATAGLIAASPTVHVDDRVLRAGTARLPLWAAGECRALDAVTMREVMGPHADAAAFLVTRPWVRTGVMVKVLDDRDPHPYWVVGTRRPERLAQAILDSQATGQDKR
jgi:hypothetical protein